jgi:hypothetical protein
VIWRIICMDLGAMRHAVSDYTFLISASQCNHCIIGGKMKIKTISLLLVLVFSIFYAVTVLSNDNNISPRLLYENKCSRCHGLDRITQAIKSPDQWISTVNRMRQKDRTWISDEESQTIATYLASYVSEKTSGDHNHSVNSQIPTYLPKLFGFITFSLLFLTVVVGFAMTHGKRRLFKIHKVIAYITLASGVIHGILIIVTH